MEKKMVRIKSEDKDDRLAVLRGRQIAREEMQRDGVSIGVQKAMEKFWAKLDAIAAREKHWKRRVR